MGGSLIQLVATGHANIALTENPQITMFHTVYRRYQPFAMEDVTVPMTGSGNFGSVYQTTVAREGDMLGPQAIILDVDPLEMGWNPITESELAQRLSSLGIAGKPPSAANISEWLDNTLTTLYKVTSQYQRVAERLTGVQKTLSSDADMALYELLAAILESSSHDTLMGSILSALSSEELVLYWTTPISDDTFNMVNLTGESKYVTLRLTDGAEIRNAFITYLQNNILISPTSELAFIEIITNFAEQDQEFTDAYTLNNIQTVLSELLNIPSEFLTRDTYKAYQFILANSAPAGTQITKQVLHLIIDRLIHELPLILFYNSAIIMNTLSTLNEIYGNITFWKVDGGKFAEIPTDSSGDMNGVPGNIWNDFTTASLQGTLLSDFYMQRGMGLTKSVAYTIDGEEQPGTLEDSSSYANMIRNTIDNYTNNQISALNAVVSSKITDTFDETLRDFTDPFNQSPDGGHPLSMSYLKEHYITGIGAENADYDGTDVLYCNGILYYVADRIFYNLLEEVAISIFNGTGYDSFAQAMRAKRIEIMGRITAWIFPLKFSELASASIQAAKDTDSGSENPVVTVYNFFKTQIALPQMVCNEWQYVINSLPTDTYGSSQETKNLVIQATTVINAFRASYNTERFTVTPAQIIPAQTIPDIGQDIAPLQQYDGTENYNAYLGIPVYLPMAYGEPAVSEPVEAPLEYTGAVQPPDGNRFTKVLDNLIAYYCTINRLTSKNYLEMYSNSLLDYRNVSQQVGSFSGILMGVFIQTLDDRYAQDIQNNPSLLGGLLSTPESISQLNQVIKSTIGIIQFNLDALSSRYNYYRDNRALLKILNYHPSEALTLGTIEAQEDAWDLAIAGVTDTVQTIDPTLVSTFFDFVYYSCFTIGEIYEAIKKYIDSEQPAWLSDSTEAGKYQEFLSAISPTTLLVNTPDTLMYTTDYFSFIINNIPDGVTVQRPTLPLFTNVLQFSKDYNQRADDILKRATELQGLRSSILAETNNSMNYAWIKRLGHYIFDWIDISIGGEVFDKHTGDYIDTLYELTGSASQERNHSELIGDTAAVWQPSSMAKPKLRITLMLNFWYCKYPGWYYPLIASQYSPLVVRCRIRDFQECINAARGSYPLIRDRLGRARAGTPPLRVSLQSRYIYLDSDERMWMAGHRHEYLYEYTQSHETVILDSRTYNWDEGYKIRTGFQNPCKAFIFQTRLQSMEDKNLWSSTGWMKCKCKERLNTLLYPYNSGIQQFTGGGLLGTDRIPVLESTEMQLQPSIGSGGADPNCIYCRGRASEDSLDKGQIISSMKVLLNGVSRQGSMNGDYYARLQTMRGWVRAPRDGIYSWNVALAPCATFPTGVVNMSRIDDTTFHVFLDPGLRRLIAAGDSVKIQITAITYGVMRCISGMVGRAFVH